MKAVMVGGPRSGEVIEATDVGETLRFAIVRDLFNATRSLNYDPTEPLWYIAIYRNRGSVAWSGNVVRVYSFEGMQQ